MNNKTVALLNTNSRGDTGNNIYQLESILRAIAKERGSYVIGLFACNRLEIPAPMTASAKTGSEMAEEEIPEEIMVEERKRGGTDGAGAEDLQRGSGIYINAIGLGNFERVMESTPSLAREFFDQLYQSTASNGCIMLPGNMQYWQPCLQTDSKNEESYGTKDFNIVQPIHFSGPPPETSNTNVTSFNQ